jgi:hypothetical protein
MLNSNVFISCHSTSPKRRPRRFVQEQLAQCGVREAIACAGHATSHGRRNQVTEASVLVGRSRRHVLVHRAHLIVVAALAKMISRPRRGRRGAPPKRTSSHGATQGVEKLLPHETTSLKVSYRPPSPNAEAVVLVVHMRVYKQSARKRNYVQKKINYLEKRLRRDSSPSPRRTPRITLSSRKRG